ncbi:hypothetical protein QYF61_011531 [Mycteria americana]|uniref:Uncharacterized protein n=1 Tax=Mycteria americana TaxID=33587 RepID=A0AAN7MYP5_MYCAM|nr:hypothetical protein QYF61_011531 [Mycteria americana]
MTLSALDAAGIFSGSYHTAVAATNKQILVSPLQGAQQRPGAKGQPTFGFTVQWQFAGTAVAGTASRGSQPPPARAGSEVLPAWSHMPPWHPEKPWLWPQTGHTHSLLPWDVAGAEVSVCLGEVVGASSCLSKEHGRWGAHLSLQAM